MAQQPLVRTSPSAIGPAPTPSFRRADYTLGVLNGALFEMGMAFLGANTVLPVFISELVDSNVAVGAAAAIMGSGWFLPQLFVANLFERSPFKMPFYRLGSTIRMTMLGFLVVAVYLWAESRPTWAVAALIFSLAGLQLGGGVGGLAFVDLVAKTIPSRMRNSFFSKRQFYGGVGAFLMGYGIQHVLGNPITYPFPYNYVLLFGAAFVLVTIGLLCFNFVREPPEAPGPSVSLGTYLVRGWSILAADRVYLRYLATRALLSLQMIALPFYAAYLLRLWDLPTAHVGGLLAAQVAGAALSNIAWGRLGDRKGSRWMLVATSWASAVSPALAFVAPWVRLVGDGAVGLLWGYLVFAVIGAGISGRGVASMTYLLDLAPQERRTVYVSFTNGFAALFGLTPLLGGALLDLAGYSVLFFSALVFAILASLISHRVPQLSPPSP